MFSLHARRRWIWKVGVVVSGALWAAACFVPGARAETARSFGHGVDGLIATAVGIHNSGPVPLHCALALAHWYSRATGAVAPGERLAVRLWADPRDGTLYVLNAARDRMPVEGLYCSANGATASVPLRRRAGAPAAQQEAECVPRGEGLACE